MGISKGLFNQTFTPQTPTVSTDAMGGQITSWTDGTVFRGRLSSLPIDEQLANDKVTVLASHKIYCDYTSSITEATRIANSTSSRYFEVKGVVNPGDANHHIEIRVLEID